ncbi:MAG: histidine kinase [Burkholderiaceae bacterium]
MGNEALGSELEEDLCEQTIEELREALKQESMKRKEAERKLQHAQHVQNVFQRIAHLGSWDVDMSTGLLNCSDEFFRICGLEPQSRAIDHAFILQITHPDDLARTAEVTKTALESREPFLIEKRIIRPDGAVRHVRSQGEIFLNPQKEVEAAIGSFLDITELKQAEEALRRSNEELRRMTAYQEKIREQERKRIACELHDELGGLLTGLRAYICMSIERGRQDPQQMTGLLGEASKIVESALDAIRRIVNDLRPSILDHFGVWAAIEWYARRAAEQAGLQLTFDMDEQLLRASFDAERGTMLFRIFQEAVTNVVRHSEATCFTVLASCREDQLQLEIHDNGKGFDEQNLIKRESWGISGMRERALQLGGEFGIAFVTDRGTTVSLSIPLENELHVVR